MAICLEKAVPLAFHLCCFYFSAVLIVGVPFPFGVRGRMWNSLFIYFTVSIHRVLLHLVQQHKNGYAQRKFKCFKNVFS